MSEVAAVGHNWRYVSARLISKKFHEHAKRLPSVAGRIVPPHDKVLPWSYLGTLCDRKLSGGGFRVFLLIIRFSNSSSLQVHQRCCELALVHSLPERVTSVNTHLSKINSEQRKWDSGKKKKTVAAFAAAQLNPELSKAEMARGTHACSLARQTREDPLAGPSLPSKSEFCSGQRRI